MSAFLKGKLFLMAGLIGLLLLAGCGGGGGGGGGSTGSVSGSLIYETDSEPITNATVVMQKYINGSYQNTPYTALTDSSGNFTISGVTTGYYRAVYTAAGNYYTYPIYDGTQQVTISGPNLFPIVVPGGPPNPPN